MTQNIDNFRKELLLYEKILFFNILLSTTNFESFIFFELLVEVRNKINFVIEIKSGKYYLRFEIDRNLKKLFPQKKVNLNYDTLDTVQMLLDNLSKE